MHCKAALMLFELKLGNKKKKGFEVFSDHNGSLLRQQPGARLRRI